MMPQGLTSFRAGAIGRGVGALRAKLRLVTDGPTGWGRADSVVSRLLFVPPGGAVGSAGAGNAGDQVVRVALLWAAVRCLVRYVAVPFGLVFLGPAAGLARGLSLACDIAAVCGIALNLRRLWTARHPARWRYLALAVGALVLGSLLLPRA